MPRPRTPRKEKSGEYKSTQAQMDAQAKFMRGKKRLTIALPEGLVDEIKAASVLSGMNIKDYIAEAVKLKMRQDGIEIDEE